MKQQRADSQENCNGCKGRSADAVGVLQISKPVLVVSLTENPLPQNVYGKLRFNLYVCSYKDWWLISAMLQQKCSDSTRRKPKALHCTCFQKLKRSFQRYLSPNRLVLGRVALNWKANHPEDDRLSHVAGWVGAGNWRSRWSRWKSVYDFYVFCNCCIFRWLTLTDHPNRCRWKMCHKILKTTFFSVYWRKPRINRPWRNVSKIQVFLEACRRSRPTSLVSVNDVTYCQLVRRLHICSYRLVTLVSLAICNNLRLLRLIWACGFLPCQVKPPKRIWIGSIQLHSYNHSPVLRIPFSKSFSLSSLSLLVLSWRCSQ